MIAPKHNSAITHWTFLFDKLSSASTESRNCGVSSRVYHRVKWMEMIGIVGPKAATNGAP